MRRRRSVPAALSALAVVVLTACSGGSAPPSSTGPTGPTGPTGTVRGAAVMVGNVEPLRAGSLSAKQVAGDNAAFGFDLFHRLCATQPATANLTMSPASAAQALGMLDAGSTGPTQAKVGALLHLPAWSNAVIAALHEQAVALGRIDQIKVSNHVFEQVGLSPTRQALDDLRTAYAADLRQLDFRNEPAATDAINAVVARDTDHLIPTLFGSSLDPATRTVLANAILLDAKWQAPFPTSQSGVFHVAPGRQVTTALMHNPDAKFASRTAAGWRSVVLPYQGGKLEAVAMLTPAPDGGAGAAPCGTPSASTLAALTAGPSQPASVVLPKLDLSQTLPLTKPLADLGLPLTGDYSGLGRSDSQISQVVQKVVMKVNQQGTKAAAATGVAITDSLRVGDRTVTFDRPFLLLLQDTATHTPLFLARVADPTAS
jgi:serpin B